MAAATAEAATTTRSWLDRLWSSIADRGRAHARVPDGAAAPLERACQLAEALLSERGEASGAAVACELLAGLRGLDAEGRAAFHHFLATGFGPDEARLRAAAQAWLAEPTPENAIRLAEAAEPPRQELLRRMNMAPGGTAALVALRAELLQRPRDGSPELRPLEADLRHLLASWFNRGFLELRRIDWQTPAAVLEKLIAYEAVHEIQGWDDLRRRLAADRRCFGFFHPALPGEPLIFVQVALTEGLPGAIGPLLARDAVGEDAARACAARADTAVFYSISNCQAGLRGISFGNFLIKQVVEDLRAELPRLARFATLSPVPGFRRWLERRLGGDAEARQGLLREEERAALLLAAAAGGSGDVQEDAVATAMLELLRRPRWWEDAVAAEALRAPLTRLCAACLTVPEGPPEGGGGARGPADPVARFHLGNGARLDRINWLGNASARGVRESFGLMVNYLYDPEAIEANHEAFVRHGTVARSAGVDALLASAPGTTPTPGRRRPPLAAMRRPGAKGQGA
jgi:malonyl-CoA decarboxylase